MNYPQPISPSRIASLTAPGGNNMPCECGGATFVIDSRGNNGGIRRRRVCKACHVRFTTYEQPEIAPKPISRDEIADLRRAVEALLARIDRIQDSQRDPPPETEVR